MGTNETPILAADLVHAAGIAEDLGEGTGQARRDLRRAARARAEYALREFAGRLGLPPSNEITRALDSVDKSLAPSTIARARSGHTPETTLAWLTREIVKAAVMQQPAVAWCLETVRRLMMLLQTDGPVAEPIREMFAALELAAEASKLPTPIAEPPGAG